MCSRHTRRCDAKTQGPDNHPTLAEVHAFPSKHCRQRIDFSCRPSRNETLRKISLMIREATCTGAQKEGIRNRHLPRPSIFGQFKEATECPKQPQAVLGDKFWTTDSCNHPLLWCPLPPSSWSQYVHCGVFHAGPGFNALRHYSRQCVFVSHSRNRRV